MADDVDIRIRLRDAAQAARGVHNVRGEINELGPAARRAATGARELGNAVSHAASVGARGMSLLAYNTRYLGVGLAGAALAGAKWGLSFDAQVENARNRFRLFTNDVDALTKGVSAIDVTSQFNFADLADAAALLGNSGIQNIPNVLQGAANAAAASGRGTEGLQSIVLALSQIQNKGRLSQEELNQLAEAGAPGVQKTIQREFGLTAKQAGNIGNQALDSRKAIDALTRDWTSGKMAGAAKRQISTLGGQWSLFTGNLQKASGALMLGLAANLEHGVLPAANRAVSAITDIFGTKGLSNEEKIRRARRVIDRELGPIADDIKHDIDRADIPGHLGSAVGAALPKMAGAAADAAPGVASAFVHAWLNSGPWAQLISALYLGKKLGGGKLAAKGIGAAIGKAAGSQLAAKGATPANPLWVAVVNNGPGGGPVGSGKDGWIKKAGKWLPAAGAAGSAAGIAAVAIGSEAARSLAPPGHRYPGHVGSFTVPGHIAGAGWLANLLFGTGGGSRPLVTPRSGSAGNVLFPGVNALGGFPLEASINIDGQRVGKAMTRAKAKQKARG